MTLKKYPDIEHLGHEDNRDIFKTDTDFIYCEEKVDGGNGSMWIEEDGIHFGSRNRDLTLENDKEAFKKYQEWLRNHLQGLEEEGIKLNPDYFYYFEWMQLHTLHYPNPPHIIGFDIRLRRAMNQEGFGLFLSREVREQEFNRLKIENVPLVWSGTVKEIKELEIRKLIPKSKYGDFMAEGLVIKNMTRKHPRENHQLYSKIVREQFKEDNRAVFGNVRNTQSDTSKIIEQFVTPARIKKMIDKLVQEEGHKLDKTLMQHLPHLVIIDVLKEEIVPIMKQYKFIDLRELKSKVPKKCLVKLLEEMALTLKGETNGQIET